MPSALQMSEAERRLFIESALTLRVAVPKDGEALAALHEEAGRQQPGAFLPRLGPRFLQKYYDFLIQEPDHLILCAADAQDAVVGFVSGSISAQANYAHLRSKKLSLLMTLRLRDLFSPQLMKEVWRRSKALAHSSAGFEYHVSEGCRIEYWAWDPRKTPRSSSVLLLLAFMQRLKEREITAVRLEVDAPNRRVWLAHKMLGATEVVRFRTPDGRDRLILEHRLDSKEQV